VRLFSKEKLVHRKADGCDQEKNDYFPGAFF
jgi:hypothetical protein